MSWQENLINGASDIRELILQSKRIAVLGIKTEAQADQPSFYVPKYLAAAGFEVIPVPVIIRRSRRSSVSESIVG